MWSNSLVLEVIFKADVLKEKGGCPCPKQPKTAPAEGFPIKIHYPKVKPSGNQVRLILIVLLGFLILFLLFMKRESFEEKIQDLNRGNYADEK